MARTKTIDPPAANGTVTTKRFGWLKAKDYRGVELFELHLDGSNVRLSGPNEVGKSARIQAFWDLVKGVEKSRIGHPVRGHQTESGWVNDADKAILDGALIEEDQNGRHVGTIEIHREIDAQGNDLALTVTSDGEKWRKAGQDARLRAMCDALASDFTEFLHARPQDQLDTFLEVFQVPLPVEQVEKITGELFEPRPGEGYYEYVMRLSADRTGEFFIRRHAAGLEVQQKEKALREAKEKLESIGGAPLPEDKEESAEEALKKLETLQTQKQARIDAGTIASAAAAEHKVKTQKWRERLQQLAGKREADAQLTAKIKALQDEQAALRAQIAADEEWKVKAEPVLCESERRVATLQNEAAALPDPSAEIQTLTASIGGINQRNKALHARRFQQSVVTTLIEEVGQKVEAREVENRKLEAIRDLRGHALDDRDIGMPEIQVGSGELLYKGLSFKEAPRSAQVKTAILAIARRNPELKCLKLDDSESLDEASERMVWDLCAAQTPPWQILAASVERGVDKLTIKPG